MKSLPIRLSCFGDACLYSGAVCRIICRQLMSAWDLLGQGRIDVIFDLVLVHSNEITRELEFTWSSLLYTRTKCIFIFAFLLFYLEL